MFEQRREKIMLVLALGLLGALVLDQMVVSPVWGYLSDVSARIAELKADVDEAERLERAAPQARRRAAAVRGRLRAATEQALNEYRSYLGAQVIPYAEVTRSDQISAVELPGLPGLKQVIYELQADGPQDALRQALENLDASRELLRLERLEIENKSLDDPRLAVKMLVSTVSSATEQPGLARGAFPPPAGPAMAALTKNIFFPADQFPGPALGRALPPALPAGEFVLAGTMISAQRRAAMLEFPASGEIRWVGVGERVGMMTVAEVRPDGVAFRLGGQQVALAVGRPGADLLAGRRVLGGGFELVGVCHGADQRFAMVQLDDTGKLQRVYLKDRLAAGVVVAISNDGIVLELAGAQHPVPVGGRFAGESQLR